MCICEQYWAHSRDNAMFHVSRHFPPPSATQFCVMFPVERCLALHVISEYNSILASILQYSLYLHSGGHAALADSPPFGLLASAAANFPRRRLRQVVSRRRRLCGRNHVPNLLASCMGLPPPPSPRAAGHGDSTRRGLKKQRRLHGLTYHCADREMQYKYRFQC